MAVTESRQVVIEASADAIMDVLFDLELTVDPTIPLPGFLIKKGAMGLMETATDGLRKRVLKVQSAK